ncbi:hypothetical protein BKA56DRAFT_605550 [Ilyonectria sp. MPI-CAGE-AT-0026]|nr:hypothetical protein BKA56DRAFT_605550 [Ilyonectria sp. MPI-CAGE-AT-0026]
MNFSSFEYKVTSKTSSSTNGYGFVASDGICHCPREAPEIVALLHRAMPTFGRYRTNWQSCQVEAFVCQVHFTLAPICPREIPFQPDGFYTASAKFDFIFAKVVVTFHENGTYKNDLNPLIYDDGYFAVMFRDERRASDWCVAFWAQNEKGEMLGLEISMPSLGQTQQTQYLEQLNGCFTQNIEKCNEQIGEQCEEIVEKLQDCIRQSNNICDKQIFEQQEQIFEQQGQILNQKEQILNQREQIVKQAAEIKSEESFV